MRRASLLIALCSIVALGWAVGGVRAEPTEPTAPPRPEPRAVTTPAVARPVAARPAPGTITMAFTGDVSMTWRALPRNLKKLQWKQNPLRFFAPELRAADLSVANFEGVLAHDDPKYAEKRLNLWAPVSSGQVFAAAGVHLVSNANNHAFDGRDVGVLRTLQALRGTGVKVFGIGTTMAEARAPYVFRRGGACVAILPGTTKSNKGVRGRARVALYMWKDWSQLLEQVRQTVKNVCPFVVVYLHWGTEKLHYPKRKIRAFGRQIIDAGARLLVGHHPHVLQGVEYYGGGAIVYSLGNFVFSNPTKSTRRTGLLRVQLAAGPPVRLARLELLPAMIHRMDYSPRPSTRPQAEDLLRRLRAYCRPFGTQVVMHRGRIRFLSAKDVLPPGAPVAGAPKAGAPEATP
jgi:poly-gamma-glutamate capsule biosynthesis protein CapA/YwtB (metallophosphatase superfamily)